MSATIIVFRCAVVLAAVMPLCAHAAPFNAKPGAWELIGSVTGQVQSAEELARKMPEQRARDEEQIRQHAVPEIKKQCFTEKDFDQDALAVIDRMQDPCTRRTITKSAGKVVAEKKCPPPRAFTMTVTFESASPESMTMRMEVAYASGGKVTTVVKGRWLGASCAGIKNPLGDGGH